MTVSTAGFTLEEHIRATPEELFRSWTDAAEMRWFAAGTSPEQDQPVTVDLRVGGAWRILMVENAERSYVTGGVYRAVEPDRVVFAWGATDGFPLIDPADLDAGPQVAVDWTPQGDGCAVRLRVTARDDAPAEFRELVACDPCRGGWETTFARLVAKYA